jgi:hypothetical protein
MKVLILNKEHWQIQENGIGYGNTYTVKGLGGGRADIYTINKGRNFGEGYADGYRGDQVNVDNKFKIANGCGRASGCVSI